MPTDAYERVRRICAALPEMHEQAYELGIRFKIRSRNVVEVFDWEGITMLVAFVDPEERHFLVAHGHPWFALQHSDKRIGCIVDDGTDWDEIAELVTESYRITAPKKLVAQLPPSPAADG